MDNPNITMEEYIRLEEEKAHRRSRVFNWQTATYVKIRVSDDLYDLRSVEAEFPAIVIDDAFAPKDTLLWKSQGIYGLLTSCTILGPRERKIDDVGRESTKSGDLEVLES
ncbi:hypothetical protein Tco_0185007 [Tanacetum coccineum]